MAAEPFHGLGEYAAAFKVPNHTEPTSKHIVQRLFRREGATTIQRAIKIVDFSGQAIRLGGPSTTRLSEK